MGAPDYDYESFGEDFDSAIRAKRLDEGLEILLGLFSGEVFNYEGDYYQVKNVKFLPTPVKGRVPIWVAGMWPKKRPICRATQYDGVFSVSVN